jgi:phage gpG-like protein
VPRSTRSAGLGGDVQIDGFRELQRDLKRYAPAVMKSFRAELRGVLKTVAADAKRRAPRRSGNLARKIGTSVTAKAARIQSRARYGHIIENGGRHPVYGNRGNWVDQPARPYLRPAARAHRTDVERAGLDAIEKARREVGL